MQELWRQLVNSYPMIQTCWDLLYIIAPISLMLAYSGIIFISAVAKILGESRNRVSFAKCARQIARLGLILGWFLLIGGRVWLYLTKGQHQDGSVENFLLEISWMLLSLGVFLTSIYYSVWGVLKNMPVLHSTLGMISAAQNCLALGCMLFTMRIISGSMPTAKSEFNLPDLFPSVWYDPVWSALCFTFPLIFAFAGAFACCWLVFLRKRDNFGRDYYNIMTPWCAAWARNSWGILWLLYIFAGISQLYFGSADNQLLIMESVRAVIWLIPLSLWTYFCSSRYPLRNKWTIFAALLVAMSFIPPYFLDITQM